jgi:hypothetical protein
MPGRMDVCGYRLPPFRLGHLRLLEIIESPFLGGEGQALVGKADLAQAVAVVRLPWRVALLVMRRPALWRWWASWTVRNVSDWQDEAKAFGDYVADCLWAPEAYSEDGAKTDETPFGYASSFAMRIAWKLSGGSIPSKGWGGWNLSIVEALAWAVTAAELSGRGFVTRDEMDTVEASVARQVEREAAQEAGQGDV